LKNLITGYRIKMSLLGLLLLFSLFQSNPVSCQTTMPGQKPDLQKKKLSNSSISLIKSPSGETGRASMESQDRDTQGNLYLSTGKQDDKLFYIKTTSHSLSVDVSGTQNMVSPRLSFSLHRVDSGKLFREGQLKGNKWDGIASFRVEDLQPDLWLPSRPALYNLKLVLFDGVRAIVTRTYRIGFRDFETRNGQIFLNGHPVFLRGIAINPPGRGIPDEVETSRQFAEEYVRFMKGINVNIIRIPDDETWYDVCDELGMMVFGGNYSAAVGGESPPADYDKGVTWYRDEKFRPIMHHPSLMIYALTNEVPYSGVAAQKWLSFLDYAFDKLKKWDDTRLYIGNAGYGYGQSGDICDLHRYWGWYYASPFTFLHIRDDEKITFPGKVQPLTFTECVGNYTGPDGRYNLTPDHKNPVSQQNWTGHAPQHEQAILADQHQCFVFKQVAELVRRLRRINPESSGVMPFTIMFRNWHTVETFTDMDPKPVTRQAKISYQPVLLSWENWQSQVYAGFTIHPYAHIINDSEDFSELKKVTLVARLIDKAYGIWISDTISLPDIPYYGIHSEKVALKLPDNLFSGEYLLEGIVFAGGKEVSRNRDRLYVGRKHSGVSGIPENTIYLYDPAGETRKALQASRINFSEFQDIYVLNAGKCVVIGENSADHRLESQAGAILNFVRLGGRIVILKQDSLHQPFLKAILPVEVNFPKMDIDDSSYPPSARPSHNSFNINPERPDHQVFSGISREQLRIWSDYTGWYETKPGFPAIYPVTNGFVLKNKADIERTAILANYSVGLEGIALAEFFEGKGFMLMTGFDLCRRAGIDPVADRLFRNLMIYMSGKTEHENLILVEAPVLWGEYETEKGILTGIYSGFMLNSRPALFGSYENLPLIIREGGHLFADKGGGWNNAAGKAYVPYGRRMFGPYLHRDFGGVPAPLYPDSKEGEANFWCRVPEGTREMETLVWNPAKIDLPIRISINGEELAKTNVSPGEFKEIHTPVKNDRAKLKITLTGDRSLVVLQTSFN
jgi:beta-galactosidase